MPVTRAQRTYPLTLTADALNSGIVAAFDWAAEDGSTTLANGKDHSGNNRNWTPNASAATIVTTSVGKGRDPSQGATSASKYYTAAGFSTLGLDVGTGDFSIWKRLRMPSTKTGNNGSVNVGRMGDSADSGKLTLMVVDASSTGGLHLMITSSGVFNWTDCPVQAVNAVVDLHITRISGTLRVYINGVLCKTVAYASSFLSTNGSVLAMGPYNGTSVDTVFIDDIYWNRGLSGTEVTAHAANPYNYYANSSAADALVVSTPAAAAISSPNVAIVGVCSGSTSVTSVEASFNGGAYATIATGSAITSFSGTLSGQAAGTGTLTIRSKNGSTVLATTTVTGVQVVTDSIAFTTPDTASRRAVPYRLYQRDGSNQATARITGTYIGMPTTIEWRHDGGTWTTLVASPAGGVFDQTVTLTGPRQGALEVRFSNLPSISASLVCVGVGDLFATIGQSNHRGYSTAYVVPVAPAANTGWTPVVLDESNTWRPDLETIASPYSNGAQGSYFGRLSTYMMATGVPVGFISCAIGSTAIAGWVPGQAYYEDSVTRVTLAGGHKAALWWQGEQDATNGTAQATYETALNSSVNNWCGTRFPGTSWVVMNINTTGVPSGGAATIRAAIAAVAASNTNVKALGDMLGKFSNSVHFGTGGTGEVEAVALTAWNAVNAAYGYTPTASAGWTEGSETFAITAASYPPGVGIAASWTEGNEAIALAVSVGAAPVAAAASWVEGGEGIAISCTAGAAPTAVTAAAAWTEGSEIIAITGTVGAAPAGVTGVAAWTEGSETIAISIQVQTLTVRAPAGSGYSPRACSNSRPAAIQGNRYDRNC